MRTVSHNVFAAGVAPGACHGQADFISASTPEHIDKVVKSALRGI